jgi:DMSO/TMAO reductase YedYZ molybdopterin-dependent catalytic subunit
MPRATQRRPNSLAIAGIARIPPAFYVQAGAATLTMAPLAAFADPIVKLPLPGGPDERPIPPHFPRRERSSYNGPGRPCSKSRSRYSTVRCLHQTTDFMSAGTWRFIPTTVDPNSFRIAVRGHVNRNLSLSLDDLMAFPQVELVAVNQCSGNSRGYFQPRVPGGEWSNGAMGNARWTGVRLKDVLDWTGVRAGAIQVRFNGLDQPIVPDAPDFMKSIDIEHAPDGEVMLAYAINGEQLPLLNGLPLRLIVPGRHST